MAVLIKDKHRLSEEIFYFTKDEFMQEFYQTKTGVFILMMASLMSLMFSPLLSLFFLLSAIVLFYLKIPKKFFYKNMLVDYYIKLFMPKMDKRVLSFVGYEVPIDKMDSHLAIVHNPQELAKKQKAMQNEDKKHFWVGIPANTFKTHFIVAGITGGGKTELVRSMTNDIILVGGGVIFNDGKSDEKMLIEVATQVKSMGRETGFRVLNFLKPEKMSETNTYNIIADQHPYKTIALIESLGASNDTQMDATHKHFVELGKAGLFCGVNPLYLRKELYGEGYDIEKVRMNTNISEIAKYAMLIYCMLKDMNEELKNNEQIQAILATTKTITKYPEFKEIEKLVKYVTENPLSRYEITKILKFEYKYIKEMYSFTFLNTMSYLKEVYSQFERLVLPVSKVLYYMGKRDEKIYFSFDKTLLKDSSSVITYEEFIYEYYAKLKEITSDKDTYTEFIVNLEDEFDIEIPKYEKGIIPVALHKPKNSIEDLPDDAVEQHNYGAQQWTSLFTTLSKYTHIFGQSKSEIKPEKILLDNQILYSLIPVIELKDEAQIIGKVAVSLIDEVASVALGGEKISLHITLKRILADRYRPKPIFIAFFDEYNSYPLPGIDIKLLQYRSLNIGVIIGIQNLAGLKVGGTDETSKANALANATKIFLKTSDAELMEWLEKMLYKEKVKKAETHIDWRDSYIKGTQAKDEEEMLLDPRKLQQFANGFGFVFSDRPFLFQSFYRGGNQSTIQIPHFVPLENLFIA